MLHRPKLSESEAAELQLDSYVMHIHNHRCQRCDCVERFSYLFEVWVHPTKTRSSALNVLKPATTLQRLAIAYIELPELPILICSDCIEGFQHHELTDSVLPVANPAAWRETLQRKYTPQPAAKPAPTATTEKKEPTLDQL